MDALSWPFANRSWSPNRAEHLAKVRLASSNLVVRSKKHQVSPRPGLTALCGPSRPPPRPPARLNDARLLQPRTARASIASAMCSTGIEVDPDRWPWRPELTALLALLVTRLKESRWRR